MGHTETSKNKFKKKSGEVVLYTAGTAAKVFPSKKDFRGPGPICQRGFRSSFEENINERLMWGNEFEISEQGQETSVPIFCLKYSFSPATVHSKVSRRK
jgi:hypothetical protein